MISVVFYCLQSGELIIVTFHQTGAFIEGAEWNPKLDWLWMGYL